MDAYWDTPLLAAIYGNLRYDNRVPEFIMVGLSYPAGKNYGTERRLDYTITPMDDKSGGAGKFLAFIQQEVVPLIELRYRGDKADRILGGVSLGGLFTLNAAYSQPDFFSGYIAISPGVEWDKQALAKVDDVYAQTHKSLSARVFISYGTEEYAPFRDPIKQFQEKMANRRYQGLDLMNHSMEGLDHVSVKGDGYVRGLMWVWLPKKPAGPSGLERDFKAGI
jgi:predicted alpha/beta superfamily hydrolase